MNPSPCFFGPLRPSLPCIFRSIASKSPTQTPCVQYMTRTNAENHFATLSPDSVSKWYAASRRSPGCLIFEFCCPADDRVRPFSRSLGILHPRFGHFRQNSRSQAPIFRRSGLKTRPSRFRAQSMTRTAAELRLRRPTCCLSSKITPTSDTICPGSHDDAVARGGPSFLGLSNCRFVIRLSSSCDSRPK